MPSNPQKVRCSYVSSDGQPCKAWAIRGSEPPCCSAHSGLNAGAGALFKDQERRTHSFYSPALQPEELADLDACAEELSLDDEIATTRVTLRRILALLSVERAERSPEHPRAAEGGMEPRDYARLARLALIGGRTVARLLRDKRALSGEAADGLAGAISQALDELSTEWGIEL
jgi:hypothetical protein